MSQQAVKLGSTEYMQGLVEAVKQLELARNAAKLGDFMEVEGRMIRALDLIRERILWPDREEEKVGFYCEDCGLVCYVSEEWLEKMSDRFDQCPQCKSWGWLFVSGEKWQPKVRYGTVERKVCERCGAIVYGARGKECPMCHEEVIT